MNSLRRLKMKKMKNLLVCRDDVKEMREALEEKTEKDFREFAKAKQKVREMAHDKFLD